MIYEHKENGAVLDIEKSSMLILHPTALPGGHGIGDFGKNAYEWIDFLEESGVRIWQVLPFGPTDFTQFSPYSSSSSVLGNFALIDLNYLSELEIINRDDLEGAPENKTRVDFPNVYKYKEEKLRKAHENLTKSDESSLKNKIEIYQNKNTGIEKELIFQMASSIYGEDWKKWPKEMINPTTDTLNNFKEANFNEYSYQLFVQYLFDEQLKNINKYSAKKNVKILGDVPIYTNFHSCDVWLNKNLFDLEENYEMSNLAGAAPDIFTAAGQIWGNPLYLWEEHKKENYKWWKDRLNSCLNKYDLLRIDHFGGLFQFWAIPNGGLGVEGVWRKGPGKSFLDDIKEDIQLERILAEDLFALDLIEMDDAREDYDIPGIRMLNQRIPHDNWDIEIPPSEWPYNCAAYTGTHDSPTTKQWLEETTDGQRKHFKECVDNNLKNKFESEVWNAISVIWETPCQLSGTLVQDILELGSEARFNIPGQQLGNWGWRLDSLESLNNVKDRLFELNKKTGRI